MWDSCVLATESLLTIKLKLQYFFALPPFDPNKPTDADKWKLTDKDGDGIVSTQELQDYEMKEMQRKSFRLNIFQEQVF